MLNYFHLVSASRAEMSADRMEETTHMTLAKWLRIHSICSMHMHTHKPNWQRLCRLIEIPIHVQHLLYVMAICKAKKLAFCSFYFSVFHLSVERVGYFIF